MEWHRLETFYYVAVHQSFTKAARALNLSQSALSMSIGLLEQQMRVSLFVRHAHGVSLTPIGEELLQVVRPFLASLADIQEKVFQEASAPMGEIILSINHGLLNGYLAPHLPEFLKAYPGIILSILARDENPDFEIGHTTMAICSPMPTQKDLLQVPLFNTPVHLYASADYLATYGTPKTLDDLDHHRLIGVGGFMPVFKMMNWHLHAGISGGRIKERSLTLSVSSVQTRLFMAAKGLGIAAFAANHPGLKQTGLVRVLPDVQSPVADVVLIYPAYLQTSKKVQVFQDFILSIFKQYQDME